ncbi:hypothetical protein [Noviherbaspirillum galbum]|uniref:Uncharacterized protein n=1 Tax=Noviherbaspirillum galbum TaxID=2709383 RepID=A0A6B3SLG4_9BURK|nr:hypothetical protein [Noviherbaspirillum galbum]NEX60215.1 hypothetical protein [Noviherbaspirillum galbum]
MTPELLTIVEHASPHYAPRTWHNAATGDLTIAFAVDFTTAGERLTRKASTPNYVGIPLEMDIPAAAQAILRELASRSGCCLNIAGNGIRTLSRHGWEQSRANAYVYRVLDLVHRGLRLERIVSGGQTGIDMAGGVAGVALGIPTELTLPKGLIQRYADGVDRCFTEAQIRQQVIDGVAGLVKPEVSSARERYAKQAQDFLS